MRKGCVSFDVDSLPEQDSFGTNIHWFVPIGSSFTTEGKNAIRLDFLTLISSHLWSSIDQYILEFV